METSGPAFESLPRERLLPVALETMHMGHLLDRALMPQVAIATGGVEQVDAIAIDEWMGASPVYTGRMRRLMGIEGDGVGAIMKALQFDVGFPHQYMDVAYKLLDERHGEFWLLHCGALMDTEPHGEKRVIGMCHTIEDPTFDATAYATNPRARIRPIHRPPRRPADRHPHCHWTIEIDPANDPVGPAKHTNTVAALPLARVPNARVAETSPKGMTDYRRPFDPGFKLGHLSSATLAAVAREFQIQCHLLSSSAELAVRERLGKEKARDVILRQWTGVAWVGAERLARALGAEAGDAEALAAVLRLHGALAPGFARDVQVQGNEVRLTLEPSHADLLDPENPGWLGQLVRGASRGLEATAQGAAPRARLRALETRDGRIVADFSLDGAPAERPQEAALMRFSTATAWQFDTSAERLGN
jgi:hypothetical protein